ncbi:isoprenyl transferase [Pseudochrobactrum sp. Wa41.01b-1]|uniref:Isoprenyl transferase n=1 Tax=Pseudochrobactrum saccharolyticum TaxID=354352 RepID=A0A7W8EPG3_9HYPH|nr:MULTISPECIES: isoprenyl transferase [Pseudochrobactrum]KAB0539192.1 isoprenyl transferase [Pseudochrobactrum saccharolyticum]MBB5090781.1 undecaprenyl diphosphate synthase [Pseudochrobactrum saccharolyticum]QYM73097.1 isoprenyl transferase [Pseudochrobactrum sp. Wa41.01b-1]UCA46767.1 isoprenyl transferase [Pseudochrobactrum sp. XF203]
MSDPRHIAIIMDGNGRWAKARGLPRVAGHKAGVDALRGIVRAAGDKGLEFLTLFAFSSENWSRPNSEVTELMGLLKLFIRRDLNKLHSQNVRVRIIGARDDLASDICVLLNEAEKLTAANSGLTLVIAFNYGARDELTRAMRQIAEAVAAGQMKPDAITAEMISERLDTADIPDPDLIIRTSGEMRLSNFLLWQAAYSEFLFAPEYWPDFKPAHLFAAIDEYRKRVRRFGGLEADDMQNLSGETDVVPLRHNAG